jgi:hypothetical protein
VQAIRDTHGQSVMKNVREFQTQRTNNDDCQMYYLPGATILSNLIGKIPDFTGLAQLFAQQHVVQ